MIELRKAFSIITKGILSLSLQLFLAITPDIMIDIGTALHASPDAFREGDITAVRCRGFSWLDNIEMLEAIIAISLGLSPSIRFAGYRVREAFRPHDIMRRRRFSAAVSSISYCCGDFIDMSDATQPVTPPPL